MPDYAAMMDKIAEWAKGLPRFEEDIKPLIAQALNRTYETGREHMVHQPLPMPGMQRPVMQEGSEFSVPPHPIMQDASAWMNNPEFSGHDYSFHTHPTAFQGGPLRDTYQSAPGPVQGQIQAAGNRLVEAPWFSSPDTNFFRSMVLKHEPSQSVRYAVGTPNEGNFLGVQVRPSPVTMRGLTPFETSESMLARMRNNAGNNISDHDSNMLRSRLQGEFGLPGDFLDNIGATAPLFKAQGDLVEPLSYHYSNPAYEDIINEYIQRSGMKEGGHVE